MDNLQSNIDKLRSEIQKLEKELVWYKDTYENRRLVGIIKDRLTNNYTSKIDGNSRLERSIHSYILNHSDTVAKKFKTHKVSIIMLSYNRLEDTKKSIRNIYKFTKNPFELIILDNNSISSVKKELIKIANKYSNLKLILETSNLGCAGGRMKAARHAQNDYLFFLDNDVLVSPFYLENLFKTLHSDESVVGVCCKVVFPDGKIQFNGGRMVVDDGYALYSLHNAGEDFDDSNSNRQISCEWIPGGATLWKKSVFQEFGIDQNMKGSFEDNEISLRITNSGYKLLNSPLAIVIHDHFDFKNSIFKKNEAEYFAGRNDHSRLKEALLHFYNKHHLIFSFAWKNNPWDIIFDLHSKDQILHFIAEHKTQNEHTSIIRHT